MLTREQVKEYDDIGLIIIPSLFNVHEIEQMRWCFEALESMAADMQETGLRNGSQFVLGRKEGEQVIKRVVWAGGSQPYLLSVGADPRLTVPAAQLLGSTSIEQLLSQAHFKRPNDGVIFGWHQDIQHRDKGNGTWMDVNGRGSFVQTLIALDDMSADSGPLQFIPGSGSWGRVDFGDHDYDLPNPVIKRPPQLHDADVNTLTARAGDVLMFGPYTAHASYENTSPTYRRVFINGYAYPGANNRKYPGDGAGRTITVDDVPGDPAARSGPATHT